MKKLLLVLLCLLTAGCGAVTAKQFDAAKTACEKYGGVLSVNAMTRSNIFETICVDGTRIQGEAR